MANNPNRIRYPSQIDTSNIEVVGDLSSEVRANDFNTLRKAVLQVEGELGVRPRGLYNTVRARLDALEQINLPDDFVYSADIKEADGSTGQDTNTGSGVKTGHIQDSAITSAKLAANITVTGLTATTVTAATIATSGNITVAGSVAVTGDISANFGAFASGVVVGADHVILYDAADNFFAFTDFLGNYDSSLFAQAVTLTGGIQIGFEDQLDLNDVTILQSNLDVISFMELEGSGTTLDGYVNIASRNIQHEILNTGGVSGTYVIDMDGEAAQNVTIVGDTYFTASNLSSRMSKSVSLRILSEFEANNLTFNGDWSWIGTKPTSLDGYSIDDYGGMLSIMSFGALNSNIVAAYGDFSI